MWRLVIWLLSLNEKERSTSLRCSQISFPLWSSSSNLGRSRTCPSWYQRQRCLFSHFKLTVRWQWPCWCGRNRKCSIKDWRCYQGQSFGNFRAHRWRLESNFFFDLLLGETDWKIICINVKDPLANQLSGSSLHLLLLIFQDIDDVEKVLPGKLKEIFEFLRDYKVPDGKPQNQFAFGGEAKNKKYAVEVIQSTHKSWEKIIQNGSSTLSV